MNLNSLVGKKIYQKQGFLQDGKRIPLTGVSVLGNLVTQIKTEGKEGYNALQLGIDIKKKAGKRDLGHSKKAGLEKAARFLKEIRVDDLEGVVLGSKINISDIFHPGDIIDVTGTSKGKGFAGGVKRHGFHGGPKTHGQSDRHRAPGSIGQGTTPGRVYKGKRMAGRMGSDTVTLKNLEIIEITPDGVLLIKGLVPGSLNSIVVVKKTGENKKFVPLYSEIKEEDSGSSPVSEDAKQETSAESLPASDDVQQVSEDKDLIPASLNESQAPISGESEKVTESLSSDSSESAQTSDTPNTKENSAKENSAKENKGEAKEGVKDANK